MTDSRSQSTYQVRLAWGIEGITQLAKSGIVIIVDAIGSGPDETIESEANASGTRDADSIGEARTARSSMAEVLATKAAALPHAPTVFIASLRNVTATAEEVYDEQLARGGRTAINLVLVGEDGRFAVEDYLAAGAIANGLSERGLDHSSPDIAVAIEGFRPLTKALKHLFSASAAGLAAAEAGHRDEVKAAALLDANEQAARFSN